MELQADLEKHTTQTKVQKAFHAGTNAQNGQKDGTNVVVIGHDRKQIKNGSQQGEHESTHAGKLFGSPGTGLGVHTLGGQGGNDSNGRNPGSSNDAENKVEHQIIPDQVSPGSKDGQDGPRRRNEAG